MMTKQQATRLGNQALRKIHNRKAWKLVVHENLGWHWTLESCDGFFTLRGGYGGEKRYSCLLSDGKHTHCGSVLWSDHKQFKDPNDAIKHTLDLAGKVVISLTKRVKLASEAL